MGAPSGGASRETMSERFAVDLEGRNALVALLCSIGDHVDRFQAAFARQSTWSFDFNSSVITEDAFAQLCASFLNEDACLSLLEPAERSRLQRRRTAEVDPSGVDRSLVVQHCVHELRGIFRFLDVRGFGSISWAQFSAFMVTTAVDGPVQPPVAPAVEPNVADEVFRTHSRIKDVRYIPSWDRLVVLMHFEGRLGLSCTSVIEAWNATPPKAVPAAAIPAAARHAPGHPPGNGASSTSATPSHLVAGCGTFKDGCQTMLRLAVDGTVTAVEYLPPKNGLLIATSDLKLRCYNCMPPVTAADSLTLDWEFSELEEGLTVLRWSDRWSALFAGTVAGQVTVFKLPAKRIRRDVPQLRYSNLVADIVGDKPAAASLANTRPGAGLTPSKSVLSKPAVTVTLLPGDVAQWTYTSKPIRLATVSAFPAGGGGNIVDIQFLPADGALLVCGMSSSLALMEPGGMHHGWLRHVTSFVGPSAAVMSCGYSAALHVIAGCGFDREIFVWTVHGAAVASGASPGVKSASPSRQAAGVATQPPLFTLYDEERPHQGTILYTAFGDDDCGRELYSLDTSGLLKVWDLKSCKCLFNVIVDLKSGSSGGSKDRVVIGATKESRRDGLYVFSPSAVRTVFRTGGALRALHAPPGHAARFDLVHASIAVGGSHPTASEAPPGGSVGARLPTSAVVAQLPAQFAAAAYANSACGLVLASAPHTLHFVDLRTGSVLRTVPDVHSLVQTTAVYTAQSAASSQTAQQTAVACVATDEDGAICVVGCRGGALLSLACSGVELLYRYDLSTPELGLEFGEDGLPAIPPRAGGGVTWSDVVRVCVHPCGWTCVISGSGAALMAQCRRGQEATIERLKEVRLATSCALVRSAPSKPVLCVIAHRHAGHDVTTAGVVIVHIRPMDRVAPFVVVARLSLGWHDKTCTQVIRHGCGRRPSRSGLDDGDEGTDDVGMWCHDAVASWWEGVPLADGSLVKGALEAPHTAETAVSLSSSHVMAAFVSPLRFTSQLTSRSRSPHTGCLVLSRMSWGGEVPPAFSRHDVFPNQDAESLSDWILAVSEPQFVACVSHDVVTAVHQSGGVSVIAISNGVGGGCQSPQPKWLPLWRVNVTLPTSRALPVGPTRVLRSLAGRCGGAALALLAADGTVACGAAVGPAGSSSVAWFTIAGQSTGNNIEPRTWMPEDTDTSTQRWNSALAAALSADDADLRRVTNAAAAETHNARDDNADRDSEASEGEHDDEDAVTDALGSLLLGSGSDRRMIAMPSHGPSGRADGPGQSENHTHTVRRTVKAGRRGVAPQPSSWHHAAAPGLEAGRFVPYYDDSDLVVALDGDRRARRPPKPDIAYSPGANKGFVPSVHTREVEERSPPEVRLSPRRDSSLPSLKVAKLEELFKQLRVAPSLPDGEADFVGGDAAVVVTPRRIHASGRTSPIGPVTSTPPPLDRVAQRPGIIRDVALPALPQLRAALRLTAAVSATGCTGVPIRPGGAACNRSLSVPIPTRRPSRLPPSNAIGLHL